MFILSDRVKETSTSAGSGSVVLNGAYGAFQSFNTGIGDGNETYYAIENHNRWEVGQGIYTASSDSLSRDVIFDSSASGNKINLEGVSVVFCTLPASKAIIKSPQDTISLSGIYFADGTFQNSASVSAGYRVYNNISSDFSMSENSDVIFLDTTISSVNVYLPTASGKGGKQLTVKFKAGSNSGVLVASGSQTIDGQGQIGIFFTYESVTLISDNSNWFLI
jgi:hypothetical protein